MIRKILPIGIQTFREIRDGDHYYVDKTDFARRLIGVDFSRERRQLVGFAVETLD
ncbi:AAA family ATPase [Thiocapsa sp. UBA6158]|jgi:hypothetical protein|uniref:AAA family ATPase n=1 Tax=Thiocapsa sp. UBA6158 TaxID=1947692 RepID=UPI0039C98F06